jgi:hypothetical protein
MFLSYSSKWFTTYDPAVFVVSEFLYDGSRRSVPFVVGPALLNGKMNKLPEGMVFSNTTVAGTHPYKGSALTLSLVLCQIKQSNYLQKLLDVVEEASSTYFNGFGTMINDYVKVAKAVFKGLDHIMSAEETQPLVGFRNEIDPNAGQDLRPGYYVLINGQQEAFDENQFWVKNNQLFFGSSADTAKPFRDNDYVLYSIMSTPIRNDASDLYFSALWKEARDTAITEPYITNEKWEIIRSKMMNVQLALHNSPDLTEPQKELLWEKYKTEIKKIRADKDQLGAAVLKAELSDFDKNALDTLRNL